MPISLGGGLYIKNKDFVKGFSDYNRVIEINPNFAGAYWILGHVFYKQKDFPKAIYFYNKIFEIPPDYYGYYSERKASFYNKNNLTQTLSDRSDAFNIRAPGLEGIYGILGEIYTEQGDLAQAISIYTQALQHYSSSNFLFYRGSLYERLGKTKQAMADYNKIIRRNPYYVAAYKKRGAIYSKQGEHVKAFYDYTGVIKMSIINAIMNHVVDILIFIFLISIYFAARRRSKGVPRGSGPRKIN